MKLIRIVARVITARIARLVLFSAIADVFEDYRAMVGAMSASIRPNSSSSNAVSVCACIGRIGLALDEHD